MYMMKAKQIIFMAEVSKLQICNKFEHAENSNIITNNLHIYIKQSKIDKFFHSPIEHIQFTMKAATYCLLWVLC
jgi:hypothetical protein